MNERDYLIWLSSVPGLSLKRQKKMIKIFGSAHDIWTAPEKLILMLDEFPKNILENIINYKNEKKVIAYQNLMAKNKIKFISYLDDNYPKLLKEINDYPLGIYVLGKLPSDEYTKISIVGSRKYTEYGAYVTHKFAYDLAKRNVVIVSGMARGIDSVAHKSTIEAGGKTIAVLGCGLNICYPPENNKLRETIINHGCLISEFALGTKPLTGNFPVRNRIISGLSKGLIVTEANEKSGTLITVGHALDQGREVMAVPGAINNMFSQGTNYLIKQGANLIMNCQDVLELIGENEKIENNLSEKNIPNKNILLDNEEKIIYNLIGLEQTSFDFIVANANLPINKLSSCLMMLEMRGIIKKLPGQKYIRA